MDLELVKSLSQLGFAGVLLGLLAWLLWKVGMRIVKALDKLIEKIEEHTKDDVERHGVIMERFQGLETRIDTALDLTPVRSHPRPHTTPRGVPTYRAPRAGTHNDGDDD